MDIAWDAAALQEIEQQVLESVGEKVQRRAKATAPVVTGDYRNKLTAQIVGDEVRIGSTSDHAIYVEADTGNIVRALDAIHEL